jgi:hypothetical protein
MANLIFPCQIYINPLQEQNVLKYPALCADFRYQIPEEIFFSKNPKSSKKASAFSNFFLVNFFEIFSSRSKSAYNSYFFYIPTSILTFLEKKNFALRRDFLSFLKRKYKMRSTKAAYKEKCS